MFGTRLKKARQDRGLTLQSLADKVGSTKSYIWELENKPSANPKSDLVAKLANELGVTADYLMGNQDEVDTTSVFFRDFSKLSDRHRKQVEKFMHMLQEDEDLDDEEKDI